MGEDDFSEEKTNPNQKGLRVKLEKSLGLGRLGGSVGWVADYSSGHDLVVGEFKPHVRLWADSSEPGAYFGFWIGRAHV